MLQLLISSSSQEEMLLILADSPLEVTKVSLTISSLVCTVFSSLRFLYATNSIEVGTTTTPAMMLRYNECCRYDVAIKALEGILKTKKTNKIDVKAHTLIAKYQHLNRELEKHALATGEDPAEFATPVLHEG